MTSTETGNPIGGYRREIDQQRLGPALLIAASMVLAIRTARWSPMASDGFANVDWENEMQHSVRMARIVLSHLTSRYPEFFPAKDVPWYVPSDDDVPK